MKRIVLSFAAVFFLPRALWASGLSATMGEVLLRNLQPGATYHLTELLKFPLRVTYEGDKPVGLGLSSVLPDAKEGKEGYEAIPDPGWIRVNPSEFQLEGSTTIESNVSIALPEDESLRGKKFIVYVWAQTLGSGKGVSLGLGTKSRLLITVAKEKVEGSTAPAQSYMSFKLDPPAVAFKNIRPGRKIQLHKLLKKKFRIQNYGGQTKKFSLKAVSGASLDMSPPQETQWGPESTEIKISPQEMTVDPGGEKNFKVALNIPDEPASYGKKFHYLLRVTPEGTGMTSGILLRIDLETAAQTR